MIKINKITKTYSDFTLQVNNLNVESGVTVILGNNGAGKTTLFRSILDLIPTEKNDISILGINNKKPKWKFKVSTYIDENFLIPYISPKELLLFFCDAYNLNKNEVLTQVKSFDFFTNKLFETKKQIKRLSSGNKQKVGLIVSLVCANNLVIWDEPFIHLDPTSQFQLIDIIKQSKNKSFLISSHNIEHIENYCDRIIILDNGGIIDDIGELEKSNWKEKVRKHFDIKSK